MQPDLHFAYIYVPYLVSAYSLYCTFSWVTKCKLALCILLLGGACQQTNYEYKYFYFTNVYATWLVNCNNYFQHVKNWNFKQNYINSPIVFVNIFALVNALHGIFFTNWLAEKTFCHIIPVKKKIISYTTHLMELFIHLSWPYMYIPYYGIWYIICLVNLCYFTFMTRSR